MLFHRTKVKFFPWRMIRHQPAFKVWCKKIGCKFYEWSTLKETAHHRGERHHTHHG